MTNIAISRDDLAHSPFHPIALLGIAPTLLLVVVGIVIVMWR